MTLPIAIACPFRRWRATRKFYRGPTPRPERQCRGPTVKRLVRFIATTVVGRWRVGAGWEGEWGREGGGWVARYYWASGEIKAGGAGGRVFTRDRGKAHLGIEDSIECFKRSAAEFLLRGNSIAKSPPQTADGLGRRLRTLSRDAGKKVAPRTSVVVVVVVCGSVW